MLISSDLFCSVSISFHLTTFSLSSGALAERIAVALGEVLGFAEGLRGEQGEEEKHDEREGE